MTPQEIINEVITKAEKKVFDLKRIKTGVDSSLQKAEAELARLKGGPDATATAFPAPPALSWDQIQAQRTSGKPKLP